VSFSGTNVPLQAVFASIEKQTGLSFFFNFALIKDCKPVTLDLKNVSLEEALHETLKDQGLEYYRSGKTIFIVKMQKAAAVEGLQAPEQPGAKLTNVKGKVMNLQGEFLVGATVAVKNGSQATLTDEKGEFQLKKVVVGAILEITYLGYQRREVEVNEGEIVRVELAVANSKLDEVQVIAYGNTTERLNVGNVTTVKTAEIEKQPVSNPLLALEGRVPGLFVTQTIGLPGGGVSVRIQGQNSIANGNDPLYVIDGVPYTSQLLPNLEPILASSGSAVNGNPFSFINPADIERIDILKDADATAIYGSRGANGAILITTKKGRLGQMQVNISLQRGIGNVARKLPLLNSQQYLQMRHEAINNDGLTVQSSDYDINGTWDTARFTDWQKVLIGRNAPYTTASADVSGGSSNIQYLIGATYRRETTVYPGDFGDSKGSMHFKINSISPNQKFRLQLSANYLKDDNELLTDDLTYKALTYAPIAPRIYNADGTLNWQPSSSGTSTWINPYSYLNKAYTIRTSNLISNAVLSYQILSGLEFNSSFGYTSLQSNEMSFYPLSAVRPEQRPNTSRSATYVNNNINSWIIEPQITYKRRMGKSRIDFLLGTTILQNNSNGLRSVGVGYNSDAVLGDPLSASSLIRISSIISTYKYNAVFGRLSYNWEEKYLLNLTARRDGSSRFGPANEFHNFGSLGVGWIFSKEALVKNNVSFLSYGKIRGSYGTSGNDQIGDYQFLSLYSPTSVPVAYQASSALAPNGLPNPYLQWELTKKLQFGIDLGAFNDRVLVSLNYYRNRSSNQLVSYALPWITGFSGINENFPAIVQNSGWEVSLNTINVKHKNFTWTTTANLTIPSNKLVSFPNIGSSTYKDIYVVGQPITLAKAFHYLGVDPTTGVYLFASSHGGTTSSPDFLMDRITLINTSPSSYGGLENNLRYKSIELAFLFQFVKQKGQNYLFGHLPGRAFRESGNQPIYVLGRWQKPGDFKPIQRYTTDFSLFGAWNNAATSDAAYADASYVRLKNLSLSWEFPENWMKKAHLQRGQIYLQGQNVLTFTKYKGLDPEIRANAMPPLRVISLGVQVGL